MPPHKTLMSSLMERYLRILCKYDIQGELTNEDQQLTCVTSSIHIFIIVSGFVKREISNLESSNLQENR